MFVHSEAIFRDRVEAGEKLADKIEELPVVRATGPEKGIVLGIPRGGPVVANQVAKRLGWPQSVVITKKVGAPGQEELAVGAMGPDGRVAWNGELLTALGLSPDDLMIQVAKTEAKIKEHLRKFSLDGMKVEGKTAVVVDDGAATGATMKAAVRWLKDKNQVIVALPVCSQRAAAEIAELADQFICLHTPESFMGVGQFYADFEPVSDEEVKQILAGGKEF